MKVSVIVPIYNVRDYIFECVNSLVNQTLKDIEIILVNDGSLDDSLKIVLDNFDDSRITIVYKENGGQASARNRGVYYARGKYLFFLDGDDFLALDALEKMYQEASENDLDIVYCNYYLYYDKKNLEIALNNPYYQESNKKSTVLGIPGPACKLIKRELYLKYDIKFLEGHFYEDLAIIPFLMATTNKISYLDTPYYYYVQRNGSTMNKKTYDKRFEDIFEVLEYLENKFIEYKMDLEFHDELEFLYIEHLLHAASLRFIDYKEGIKNIKKISNIMKEKYPNYQDNKYYKLKDKRYKIYCNLFYKKRIFILKALRLFKKGSKNG